MTMHARRNLDVGKALCFGGEQYSDGAFVANSATVLNRAQGPPSTRQILLLGPFRDTEDSPASLMVILKNLEKQHPIHLWLRC